tara:strand:+ start:801 stop:941 length:141 start_codon:yes stop_codon:yes gene_type:complete
MHHHKWDIDHLEHIMPWEKEIYVHLLINHLKEEEKRYKDRQKQKAM